MAQSGCYLYRQDGRLVAREPWCVETGEDGIKRISSHRDATNFGVWLELNAVLYCNGTCEYDFCFKATQTGPELKSTSYIVKDGRLFWAAPPTKDLIQMVPPDAHFFPLMRYFTGNMVRAIAKAGGAKTIIVPDIRNVADLSNTFKPLASERRLVNVQADAKTFDLTGGAYDAPARLYLNEAGQLTHYGFTDPAGHQWTCDLEAAT